MTAVGSADRYGLDKGGRDRPMDTRHAMLRPTYMLGPVHIVFFLRYSSVYILCLLLASVCTLCMSESMCILCACCVWPCMYCAWWRICVHFVLAICVCVCTVHVRIPVYTLCLLLVAAYVLCMTKIMCTLCTCYLRLCVYCACRNPCVHFVLRACGCICTVHVGMHVYTLCLLLPSVNALCMAASLKGCARENLSAC